MICVNCGNIKYFEAEVETVLDISCINNAIRIENSNFNGWDQTDESIRGNLEDVIGLVLRDDPSCLKYDHSSGLFFNTYVTCGKCGSCRVTVSHQRFIPPKKHTIHEEIFKNRKEYLAIKKGRRQNENTLPVVWKQFQVHNTVMDEGDIQI